MKLSSSYPVSLMAFKHWAPDDREVGVVVAKALFRRQPDGHLRAEAAPEINMEDMFAGDPAWTPLIRDQDIAPGKRGTDLTIAGTARSIDGKLRRDWAVEVTVPDRLNYHFHVRGPSAWARQRGRWKRSAPEPVAEVPITYGLAYGGVAPGSEGVTVHDYNPAGIGLITHERLAAVEDIPAPQIGLLADFMNDDPLAEMAVHGTGPIAKAWLPRRAFAGTFDKDWLTDRHPRMPADYDLQFWNAAPRPLQIKRGLRGDEVILVNGMTGAPAPLSTPLPNVWCGLRMTGDDSAEQVMSLDTVHLDLTARDPLAHTATLLWRMQVDRPDQFREADLISGRIGER